MTSPYCVRTPSGTNGARTLAGGWFPPVAAGTRRAGFTLLMFGLFAKGVNVKNAFANNQGGGGSSNHGSEVSAVARDLVTYGGTDVSAKAKDGGLALGTGNEGGGLSNSGSGGGLSGGVPSSIGPGGGGLSGGGLTGSGSLGPTGSGSPGGGPPNRTHGKVNPGGNNS